tara:strand:+ start:788 stop:2473 length:1686 start_codon:yes stop_codon:yes gene_type:complete
MFYKKIKFILYIFLFYQIPVFSQSASFDNFDSKNLSRYFSGIVAHQNKDNTKALSFFNTSKVLINKHDPYFKRYIYSLVLENKINQAIYLIKNNKSEDNLNFFDAHFLLIIDSIKKNDLDYAYNQIIKISELFKNDKFNLAILESLKQYIYVFKEKKFLRNKKNFGTLSIISETFQLCYLNDEKTENYFLNLINDIDGDYTRYNFFYLSYLIENNEFAKVKQLINDIEYINTTLLLSQAKSWIENGDHQKFKSVFSCKSHNDIISEFIFLISNLYSSDDNFDKSNFYLNLANFLNPRFIFNLSLVAENQFLNNEFIKAKQTLKNFKKEDKFYFWYRIKKEAQIIAKERNKKESVNYITSHFKKIDKLNDKILFDLANFLRNSKEYKKAINYYTEILNSSTHSAEIKSEIYYRRGSSYERIGNYEKADKDLIESLKINPDDAYVLNYLAYSWLERDYKIDEALEMLIKAYNMESDDPYIIDSIGWAYYLIKDYLNAERFLKRAVELMPDDPTVNDHYGDILWKLDRKIQARYFWNNVLEMKDLEEAMRKNIHKKMVNGLISS